MRYAAGYEYDKADDMQRFASKSHALAYACGYADALHENGADLANHDGAVVLKRRFGGWKRIARVG